ncbi:MAG: type VI secretion system accessory protein TagJ [Phenylobacterium sp.]
MADADELLRAGDLEGARLALIDRVKGAPDDQPARMFLFQLLCVMGAWDKAKAQLRLLAQMSPEAQMLSVAYNMALDAELEREKTFSGAAPPALLVNTSEWAGDLAAAVGFLAQGRVDESEAARDRAFDAAPDTPGRFGEQAFDWIADADVRFGPAFEAVIYGRWGLVPFDAVRKMTSEGPQDLRDLVWLPVEIEFKTGQSVAAILPARYPGTEASGTADLMLSRGTEWRDGPTGPQGLGQRVWALGDGDEVGLLSLRRLTFD